MSQHRSRPGATSPRRYCTPQKRPAAEATQVREVLPKLPSTEAEALHGLTAALSKLCCSVWEYRTRAEYHAFKPWLRAAEAERDYLETRLRVLTDGR